MRTVFQLELPPAVKFDYVDAVQPPQVAPTPPPQPVVPPPPVEQPVVVSPPPLPTEPPKLIKKEVPEEVLPEPAPPVVVPPLPAPIPPPKAPPPISVPVAPVAFVPQIDNPVWSTALDDLQLARAGALQEATVPAVPLEPEPVFPATLPSTEVPGGGVYIDPTVSDLRPAPSQCAEEGYVLPNAPLPPVPAGVPCLVTPEMVAQDNEFANRDDFTNVIAKYAALVYKQRAWALYGMLSRQPRVMHALVQEMSASTWNLIVPEFGYDESWKRVTQAYGPFSLSERYIVPLHALLPALIGALHSEIGPLPNSVVPAREVDPGIYTLARLLVTKESSILWGFAYAGQMSQLLGYQLQLATSTYESRPTAAVATKKANSIANSLSPGNPGIAWLRAWWRRGSVAGASEALINETSAIRNFVARVRSLP